MKKLLFVSILVKNTGIGFPPVTTQVDTEHLHMSIYQCFLDELIHNRIITCKRYCEASSTVHCSILCGACNGFAHKGTHDCQHKLSEPRCVTAGEYLYHCTVVWHQLVRHVWCCDENSCHKH